MSSLIAMNPEDFYEVGSAEWERTCATRKPLSVTIMTQTFPIVNLPLTKGGQAGGLLCTVSSENLSRANMSGQHATTGSAGAVLLQKRCSGGDN
jgi:hypothetical protein